MSILTNSIRPTTKKPSTYNGGTYLAACCYRCQVKSTSVNNYGHAIFKRVCTECRAKLDSYKLKSKQSEKGVDKS